MAKAVFYIKDHVQEVGFRAFIMQRILETNLKGGAINTEDGSIKVLLEGDKEEILDFCKKLKIEKPELAKNPAMGRIRFDERLQVPDEIRMSHSLEMNQFGKAVTYLSNIDSKLDKLGEKFDEMPDKIANKLGEKFDELPGRIAQAMKS